MTKNSHVLTIIIVLLITLPSMIFVGCDNNKNNYYDDGKTVGGLYATEIDYVWDAGGVCKFTLPFETYGRKNAPSSKAGFVWFETDLDWYEMRDAIVGAGQRAEFEYVVYLSLPVVEKILIYVERGGKEFVFQIIKYDEDLYCLRY